MTPAQRPRPRKLLAPALACLVTVGLHASAAAQSDSISSTAHALQAVNGEAAYNGKLPTEVRGLLTQLKHQLRDLVQRTLDEGVTPTTTPRAARAKMLGALGREGVSTGWPKDDVHTFGSITNVEVTRPRDHPNLLAVVTTVSVHCGEDSSLYLFRRERGRWKLVLAEEANGYEDVSGAQGRFGFRVSPPDARGRFFVVTANVNPWCTSFWQALRYRVLRVGGDAYDPRVVLRGEEVIYLGTALEGYRLGVTANTFTLRFDGYQNLDPGIGTRTHILKFAVAGDRAARVAPVALKPEDFSDEWLQMKWEEAARWSDPSRLADLKRWHAALNPSGKGFDGEEILFVQPCRKAAREWRIGVASRAGEGAANVPPKLYFTVAREGGAFIMRGVADKRPPGCPGESPASDGR
jgi:hypothetical protein